MIKTIKWLTMILSSIFLILALVLGVLLWPGASTEVPEVSFHYSAAVDQFLCPSLAKSKILPSWDNELAERAREFDRVWNMVGPNLLQAASQIVGKPFSKAHFNIPIFLCPALPGWGFPIAVPVNMFLHSASGEGALDIKEFPDVVFHEILHLYTIRALGWNFRTPLLSRFKDEAVYTKLHLHLYALQKAVYTHIKQPEKWKYIIESAKSFPPAYARAFELVELEGMQPFIDELRHGNN